MIGDVGANVCACNVCFFWCVRPLVCEDIQADVEDGQLQFFYILAFVLQGELFTHSAKKTLIMLPV